MNRGMKMMALSCALFGLSGCGIGLLSDMSRSLDDPVVREPDAESFVTENTITVRWEEDAGTDEFVLFRAVDSISPSYEIVYRGTSLEYADSGLDDGDRYLYALGNTRGTRLFGPSGAVLGVGSDVRRDEYEPNDERESATELSTDLTANIFFFSAYSGATAEDLDWYVVTVPPQRQANIVLVQRNLVGSGFSYMDIYIENESVEPITSGSAIAVPNYEFIEKEIRFRISPNAQRFFSAYSLAGGGLEVYDLSLSSITEIG